MYKIYPTLIDNYNYYMVSEMSDKEMIDRINRVETPVTDAQIKGKGLNNLVDAMLQGYKPTIIESRQAYVWVEPIQKITDLFYDAEKPDTITLEFDIKIVDEIVCKLKGATIQAYSEAIISTDYGDVLLYGYQDYLIRDKIIDLKTTSRYDFPKYYNAFQHKCYLYTMRESGNYINLFDYIITDFRHVFIESYNWHDNMIGEMKAQLSRFLGFVESNISVIHNTKLLGNS